MRYVFNLVVAGSFCLTQMASAQQTFAARQQSADSTVAILRGDGIVEPFATWRGNRWQSTTRKDLSDLEWRQPHFYLAGADSVETLWIGTPVEFDPDGMNGGSGFISSFSGSDPGFNGSFPKPKAGVVLNWMGDMVRFRELTEKERTSLLNEALIGEIFRAKEDTLVLASRHHQRSSGDVYTQDGVPVDASMRESMVVEVMKAEISDRLLSGKRYIFFSATRTYPGSECASKAFLQAWVVSLDDSDSIFPVSFSVADCDGKGGAPWVTPLLVFSSGVGGRIYAAAELSYYEGEGRQLYEFSKDGVAALFNE